MLMKDASSLNRTHFAGRNEASPVTLMVSYRKVSNAEPLESSAPTSLNLSERQPIVPPSLRHESDIVHLTQYPD